VADVKVKLYCILCRKILSPKPDPCLKRTLTLTATPAEKSSLGTLARISAAVLDSARVQLLGIRNPPLKYLSTPFTSKMYLSKLMVASAFNSLV
jgi:hypothetical protein